MAGVKPTPIFERVREYPTPLVADIIVRQKFNTLLETNPETNAETIPSFGSAHPDTVRYANYKVVHREIIDEDGQWALLHYAKDRDNQEEYNYSLTYPFGGNPNYPRITRTYVLARGDNSLEPGSADPGETLQSGGQVLRTSGDDIFRPDGSSLILRPGLAGAVLVAQAEERLPQPLGNVYVQVTRVYDVIPGAEDAVSGSGLGQVESGYKVERPLGTDGFLKLVWKLVLPRSVADNAIQTDYAACPIPGYENLVLTTETVEASDDNNQESVVTRTYEGNSNAAGSGVAFPSVDAVQYHGKFYPSALPPAKFIVTVHKLEDEYEIIEPGAENVNLPLVAPGSPATLYLGGLEKVEAIPKDNLRGKKKVSYYTTLTVRTLNGRTWDDRIRDYISYTTFVLTKTEADALGAAETGTERTITPFNANWSIVTIEAPTETNLGVFGRGWKTGVGCDWPRVLISLRFGFVGVRVEPGGELSTAGEFIFDAEYKPHWSGICQALIEIAWKKEAPLFSAIENMDTTGLQIDWPGVAQFSIPECLHPGFTGDNAFHGTTGSDHPKYGPIEYLKEWEATTYTDWPASLVKDFDCTPYKGGFILRRVTVFRPY